MSKINWIVANIFDVSTTAFGIWLLNLPELNLTLVNMEILYLQKLLLVILGYLILKYVSNYYYVLNVNIGYILNQSIKIVTFFVWLAVGWNISIIILMMYVYGM